MPEAADVLLNLLNLEELDRNLFRGVGSGGETPTRIYGGQVIAQALMAAYLTVPDRLCHSLHAYFIRPGDPSKPVIYVVDPARDGGSFTTRRVTAMQNGKQILNLAASFHINEPGWEHQHDTPQVPGPEQLVSREDLHKKFASEVSEKIRVEFTRERPFEIRDIDPRHPVDPGKASDINHMWVRMKAAKNASPQLQHVLMAYVSDYGLLGSALRPHGLSFLKGEAMTASLDHAMWFHAPVQFDAWHLYTMDSPFAGGGRGFNRGSIFTEDGRLVASVAQEGLMRPITKT